MLVGTFPRTRECGLTFPIPLFPIVADVLLLSVLFDDPADDPKYISFFFFTPGVAKVVVFATF